MSETMDPQDISEILNDYFERMTEILFSYDGTLDKFMGDAIMAFFGNPHPHKDHAFRAICMSLEMMQAVVELNEKFSAEGRKTFNIGIGINTGDVTVGNLGSDNYFDYTVIGDDVNLACRLESIAQAGQIIIDFAEEQTGEQIELVEINEVAGLYEVVVLYQEQEIPLYLTTDGENLVQGITPLAALTQGGDTQTTTEVTKSDKPEVKLFIMTHCPYGTQAEKGFIPVMKALGNTIDASIRFVHYFMHEPEETETPPPEPPTLIFVWLA